MFKLSYATFGLFIYILSIQSSLAFERLAPELSQQFKLPIKGNGAEVLYSITQQTVSERREDAVSSFYYSIRINDEKAARDYGKIALFYDRYIHNIKLNFAQVMTPTGEIEPLRGDATQERKASERGFYDNSMALEFSLPKIEPGSIIEFQYQLNRNKLPENALPDITSRSSYVYWYQPTSDQRGARMDYVHHAEFNVSINKGTKLHIETYGPKKPKYKVVKDDLESTHQWRWKGLPTVFIESFMPNSKTLLSGVRTSTSQRWESIDSWFWRLNSNKFTANEAINQIVQKIKSEANTTDQKIKAVYSFMQEEIRYVYAHLGRNGYEAHQARDILQQGYGDCKDQTILGVTLLNALGVEAYPALISTTQSMWQDSSLVSMYFDHMLVAVKRDNENYFFIDTSGDHMYYPGVSSGFSQSKPFVLDKAGGLFADISKQLDENLATLDLNYKLLSDNQLEVDATITPSGSFEQYYRSLWNQSSQPEDDLKTIFGQVFPNAQGNSKTKTYVENGRSLYDPIILKATITFDEQKDQGTKKPILLETNVVQALRVLSVFSDLQDSATRRNPWVYQVPYTVRQTASFNYSKHHAQRIMFAGSGVDTEFFNLTQKSKLKENKYKLEMEFIQRDGTIPLKKYEDYVRSIHKLGELSPWVIAIKPKGENTNLAYLDNSSDEDIQKLQEMITKGKFEEGLTVAEKLVKEKPTYGKAWYYLGLFQGYNFMMEESKESFGKANSFGYHAN